MINASLNSTEFKQDIQLVDRIQSERTNMAVRNIDPDIQARDEDWEGNNAAFSCPVCGKVFIVSSHMHIVSSHMHEGTRECPSCHKSTGYVVGGKKSGGSARIEWKNAN